MVQEGLSDKTKLGQVLKEARGTAVQLSGVQAPGLRSVRTEAGVCALEQREAGLRSTRSPCDVSESGWPWQAGALGGELSLGRAPSPKRKGVHE